jgi:hypothetical protein
MIFQADLSRNTCFCTTGRLTAPNLLQSYFSPARFKFSVAEFHQLRRDPDDRVRQNGNIAAVTSGDTVKRRRSANYWNCRRRRKQRVSSQSRIIIARQQHNSVQRVRMIERHGQGDHSLYRHVSAVVPQQLERRHAVLIAANRFAVAAAWPLVALSRTARSTLTS